MKWVLSFLMVAAAVTAAALTPFGAILVRLSEKLPILLSVLLAAVFVRLARGMPTVPYEKVSPSRALVATQAFRALVKAYVQTFLVFVSAIVINLSVSTLTSEETLSTPVWIMPVILALSDSLVIISIIFLVMSDVALANIQADMMDEVTNTGAKMNAAEGAENVRRAFEGSELPKIRSTDV